MINIDNIQYKINDNEYVKVEHKEYTNLRLHNDIGTHERLIGLIKKCASVYEGNRRLLSFNITHGGFIPINLSNDFNEVYIIDTDEDHYENINYNINNHNLKNFIFQYPSSVTENQLDIYFIQNSYEHIDNYLKFNYTNWIAICKNNYPSNNATIYKLNNSDYYIYVDIKLHDKFFNTFKYYIDEQKKIIDFDNLINLCIMVKNAGPQFEEMLQKNLSLIDNWTILDTGSTDETLNIINKVLVGKKEGKLYNENFINFRDSRNRLLQLAGTSCKFNLMLDDTYVVEGNLREFLNEVRSDQYSNSFTLFIKSDDTIYGSNRITKSICKLRYIHKIHEVISDKDAINVVIPKEKAFIYDRRFDYMEKRTMERKQLDFKLLFEEIEDNPNDPRAYYYLGQTYNLIGDYEKAYFYFLKRCEFINSGFLQERVDAAFEAARIANFKLNLPWNECENLYFKAFKIDESRPESLYFIGIHYYLENNYKIAYKYLKQAFEIGFPIHCQYSLKPTLSFHFVPKFLARICYSLEDFILGEEASRFFLLKNNENDDDYQEILSWYKIYEKLNKYKGENKPKLHDKPIFCFVADGGFEPWSGTNILTSGVGGSETYIIEMARYIKQNNFFGEVIVFCNTPYKKNEIFEGVLYTHLDNYYEFIKTNYVHTCIISRFSEYLPVAFNGYCENVYLVIHDLLPSGIVIPNNIKLKNIFCLTEWHVKFFINVFPMFKHITVPFYYGIDDTLFPIIKDNDEINYKEKFKFIYSSYPNRGLYELLLIWPEIYAHQPKATLHIYSNIFNEWSNNVEPEKMNKIKDLLNLYLNRTDLNQFGIHYHGWVCKKLLAQAWKTASIWFYPCTFKETFCLTALEAAKSKTFVITNGLAALENTVSDRGIIIEGDPQTEEWKRNAIKELFYYMDDSNIGIKEQLIQKNYDWAHELTWENQAEKLLNCYLIPNGKIEYKGMYNWTNNIPQGTMNTFMDIINNFNNSYWKIQLNKEIKILEIGSYTGTSLIKLVSNIPNSKGYAIDTWSSYDENTLLSNMDNLDVKGSFHKNVKAANLEDRIKAIQMSSKEALMHFLKEGNIFFDFIYIDGSHLLLDAYADMILSWEILYKHGIMAIDDYLYNKDELLKSPFEAVNHFLKLYNGKYKLLHSGYRIFLEKL